MEEAGVDELLDEAVVHSQDEALFGDPTDAEPRTPSVAPLGAGTASATAAPLALYRRYRPDTFADVIGQEHVTDPLQRALTNNRVNHAYLFSGPRGCGKTTSARILARALNCESGPRAEPCGECGSCRDLARGGPGSIDVIEIDAASHGGVDDARDLRERAFFAPVSSRYKIYIVDEAHMVTTAGFNALLKLVEEPPPHVKFIFATTEPDKVIGTIRSRTHHYPFRLVPPRVLSEYLAKLCAAEGIAVEPAVLPLVVRAGAGSVRDSLSVLDQLLGGAEESGVAYRQATALLGYTPDSLLDEFVDAFAAGDAGGVFSCVDKVIEVGQDPRRFAEDLLRRLRDLVIVAAVPDAISSGLVDVAPDQGERLVSQAAALGPGELTRAAEVLAVGLTEMRGTTAPRLHLELMCARVLLPGADTDGRGIHARLDRLERRLGVTGSATTGATRPEPARPVAYEGVGPSSATDSATTPARGSATSSAPPVPVPGATPAAVRPEPPTLDAETEPPTPAAETGAMTPAEENKDGDTRGPSGGESDDTALGTGAEQAQQPPGSTFSVTDVRRLWPEVLEEVKGKRRFTWILLSQNAQVAELRDNTLLLAMSNAGARDSFSRGGSEDVLREAIVVVLGADFRIETMVDPSATPGGVAVRPGAESDREPPAAQPERVAAPERDAVAQAPTPPRTAPRAPEPGSVRTTRRGDEDRDAVARRDDSDLDEGTESHAELLARHLGAEIIAEEEHDA